MGLKNYLKGGKKEEQKAGSQASSSPHTSYDEKSPEHTLVPPSPGFMTPGGNLTPPALSSRNSFSGSVRSSFMDDIKHEVMVNYLFQQQCSSLWVGDGSGQVEGVMLRKSRGHYLSCPPQLVDSPFGQACAALNVQVSTTTKLK